jgi:hypothetical protein
MTKQYETSKETNNETLKKDPILRKDGKMGTPAELRRSVAFPQTCPPDVRRTCLTTVRNGQRGTGGSNSKAYNRSITGRISRNPPNSKNPMRTSIPY